MTLEGELQSNERSAVIFVHGLFSSPKVWTSIERLIADDSDLSTAYDRLYFAYSSPKWVMAPSRRVPDMATIAESLSTYIDVEALHYQRLAIVAHSQGGLIVQRYLAKMLSEGRGAELSRIRRIVLFACPNSGSEFFLLARRSAIFWRHSQERNLRPLNDSVVQTQRQVLNGIVHATAITSASCPIPIAAYAAESDNVVSPSSALSVFPILGALPGDHSSVIQTPSRDNRTYTTLKRNLAQALQESFPSPDVPTEEKAVNLPIDAPPAILEYLTEFPEFAVEHDIRAQCVRTSRESFMAAARIILGSLNPGERVIGTDSIDFGRDHRTYWTSEGLEYLHIDYEAARRGVDITRIFVVSKEDYRRHKDLVESLCYIQSMAGVDPQVVIYEDMPATCRYEFALFGDRLVDEVVFDMRSNAVVDNYIHWSPHRLTLFRERARLILRYAESVSTLGALVSSFDEVTEAARVISREIREGL